MGGTSEISVTSSPSVPFFMWEAQKGHYTDAILYLILIPNGLFVFSVVVLVYWSDHPISFSNLNFVKSQISQNDNLDDLALDFNYFLHRV